jgi:hypothetical protein
MNYSRQCSSGALLNSRPLKDERPALGAGRSEGGEMYLRFELVGKPTSH